jgi:cytochrome P450
MQRTTVKPLKLSNGLVIPKGERVWVDVSHMWTDEYYKNPDEFNPYRFINLRGTNKEHMAHFVSTSTEHIGFGHGEHACPGRFFAANEIKILLCHMLLKYEWKLPEGHDPKYISVGLPLLPNPRTRMLFRRRQEEIDLGSIEC